MSSLVMGIIWSSRKLTRRNSVLCGPSTGVIDGGGGVPFEVVRNPELDIAVGSLELVSRPHRGRNVWLSAGSLLVFVLSNTSSVADER